MKKLLFAVVFSLVGAFSAGATTIVSDPSLDSTARDFTQITGSYDDQNVYFTASFRQGTLQRNSLGFAFYVNTDMNSATGSGGIGIDYSIFYHQPINTTVNFAFVTNTATGVETGRANIDFAADFLSVAVPLAWLGNDDGIMQFTAMVGTAFFDYSTGPRRRLITPEDWVPDPARTWAGPTTPVPEPGTMMLLGIGMLGLAVFGKRCMNRES